MKKTARVRFAPSPTGFLHVGGLRTALFNYLFAAAEGGRFILRIEDTDQARKVEGAEANLIESLRWAGLQIDEGPGIGGDFGPYVQSERLGLYREHADLLLEKGDAYRCFCSQETLNQMREEQTKRGLPPRYDGRCRKIPAEEAAARAAKGEKHVIRMKIRRTAGILRVEDLIRGSVDFKSSQIDDQVLMKSDGFPTYHLANVVDDRLMNITHVIRGEEWLPSTPKHLQLYESFGWEPPAFAHLPLLLNPDRSKLSKRQGDVATEDFRAKGYLPEALVNFVALLGWNPGDNREIFSLGELREEFNVAKVNKSNAVFDLNKLNWINQEYIKKTSAEDALRLCAPFLNSNSSGVPEEKLKQMLEVVKNGMSVLGEINERLELFLNEEARVRNPELLKITQSGEARKIYRAFLETAPEAEEWNAAAFVALMKKIQKLTGLKGKALWKPMRIAVTLAEQGPELPAVAEIFGREKCLAMIRNVLTQP